MGVAVMTLFYCLHYRLITIEPISHPLIVLGVGAAGLVINIMGLIIFGGHAHGHSHGHNHNSHQKDDPGEVNKDPRPLYL